jgi:GTP pyrophosphokinase
MGYDKLLQKAKEYLKDDEIQKINKAYSLAEEAHKTQVRNSGEPFIVHPVAVAITLAEYNMDADTIIAGLLHDVVEDTDFELDYIEEKFGIGVATLVDGVTKLKKIQYRTKEEHKADNLRKMVIAMAKDIRVIIIKLTDRLHNMQTLEYMSDKKKKEKATETLEIYAPIANRLGMNRIKAELEDLSLKYLNPEKFNEIREKVAMKKRTREAYLSNIMDDLDKTLDQSHISHQIMGRPKHFYSIYRKMAYQNKEFEQIFDVMAVRVIVESTKDCYGVLGLVHTMWKPLPNRFKDYIAMPKANMYQSLHTTVIGPSGEIFEIQIRTEEMHKMAEYGIAAHWKYKMGTDKAELMDDKLDWIKRLLEVQEETNDPKEFLESMKMDFFTNEVFVFTPQGDVINLPQGSTPIDFAYRVHTAVGNRCVGAKVDGRIVPIDYKLKNGNIVEVLTSPNSNGPSRDWLKIVKSTQARNKIRNFFKKEEHEQNVVMGKDKLEKEVKRQGFVLTEILKEPWIKEISEFLRLNGVEDLYAAIGYGSISLSQVVPKLKNYHKEHYKTRYEAKKQEIQEEILNKKRPSKPNQGVVIKGIDNIKVRFARCCNPLPGDDIVGYITRGRGVSVHRSDCTNIGELSQVARFIEVEWDIKKVVSYQAEIQVKAVDRSGLLSQVNQVMSETNLVVSSVNARKTKEGYAIINLIVDIKDIKQLELIMKKIRTIKDVIDVYRVIS